MFKIYYLWGHIRNFLTFQQYFISYEYFFSIIHQSFNSLLPALIIQNDVKQWMDVNSVYRNHHFKSNLNINNVVLTIHLSKTNF